MLLTSASLITTFLLKMQSHLEAALLGCSSNVYSSTSLDDDEHNFRDEEGEEAEGVEEDIECESGSHTGKHCITNFGTSRTVTLQMLLSANILQPGKGTMTIEYLGQKFTGNLLEDGKIQSQETNAVFTSPSAWAIACKRFINPEKKSGCGWASIKYCGRKLDVYKNIWYRKKNYQRDQEIDILEFENLLHKTRQTTMQCHRIVKHNAVGNRTVTHDANTMVECSPFSNLGKIQPFLISLATNAALLMDFHCHLTKSEVCGYLGGHWDVNNHSLQVTHVFPCRNSKCDKQNIYHVEAEICGSIEQEKVILVGWYHSHPFAAAAPTLRDVDAQLDYQIRMKGTSDNNYTPCIGIIISPYNYENNSLESNIVAYWVIPPPETKPNEYGRPMLMSYSVIQDSFISSFAKKEIKKCVEYYARQNNFVNFNERYASNSLYIDKLKSTLIAKFPKEENEIALWQFIKDTLGYHTEENDCLLSIPSVSKSPVLVNSNPSLSSNLMIPNDIPNFFFNSGKFPTTSSLLGLPDPMAQSTLAANNMFLSTNLFKMQELLKPLSVNNSFTSKSKNDTKHSTSLIIPTDLKNKSDFAADLLNLKNKLDFIAPDLNLSNSDLVYNNKQQKQGFCIPEYSGSLNKSLDLCEPPSKIPKNDPIAEDTCKRFTELNKLSSNSSQSPGEKTKEDKPLNLAID